MKNAMYKRAVTGLPIALPVAYFMNNFILN